MKVLIIGTDNKLFETGSEIQERMITLGAMTGSLDIIVFSTQGPGDLQAQDLSPEVRIYRTNSYQRWFYMWDAIRLGKNLPRPDLITAQDPFECGLVAWKLAKFFKAKLQLQVHTDFLNPAFSYQSILNHARVVLAQFLLARADKIRVVSQRIKDSLSSEFKIPSFKINILPVFIDVDKIQTTLIQTDLHKKYPRFRKIILMASRLSQEKNIDLAIKAMPGILARDSHIGLIIVGEGPELKHLKALALKCGLGQYVVFESWTKDLPSYYKTADLFLNTSLYEGYGRTLVEALVAGCSVASTNVGLVGDPNYRGIIVIDQVTIGQLILNLLSDHKPPVGLSLPYRGKLDYLRQYNLLWLN